MGSSPLAFRRERFYTVVGDRKPVSGGKEAIIMDVSIQNPAWDALTRAEKNHQLFLSQKHTLALFLERGAISRAQHDKSLRDLEIKMGEK